MMRVNAHLSGPERKNRVNLNSPRETEEELRAADGEHRGDYQQVKIINLNMNPGCSSETLQRK